MKTKRKYAHELYPHADEYEVRPIAVEVPYLYARAIGHEVWCTGWHDAPWRDNPWAQEATTSRTIALIEARHKALLADAILQGMSGQEAWTWAEERMDEEGGWIYDRAKHYGIDVDLIKPYPCGPEPDHHNHHGEPDQNGWRTSTRVTGKESECEECCEPLDPREPGPNDVPMFEVVA